MNYDLEAARLKKDWAENPRWKGIKRGYTAEDVVRLRGSRADRAHARAARRREALEARATSEPFVNALGALTGNQAMQQVKAGLQGDLPVRLAGRGRRQHRRRDVSRPVAVPGQLGADGRQAHQQHLRARRPDPARRRQGRHRLLRADRRRRRSRLRRRAERLRADEGDDRGRRRRRALRGPARLGEEVRPHGRQGAGADAEAVAEADRRAPGRRRDGRADDAARAHRRRSGRPASPRDVDENDKPFLTGERTVEGFYKTRNGLRPGDRRAASPTRRTPTWSGARPASRTSTFAKAVRRGDPREVSRARCSPTTARRRSTGRRTSTTRPSPSSSASSARWATSSSSSRWPASTALNYSMFDLAHGYARNNMSAFVELQQKPSSPPPRRASPRSSTSAKSAPATSTR